VIVKPGDIVVIKSYKGYFKEDPPEGMGWGEHHFKVQEVYGDLVTGYSLHGELEGEYGEPDLGLIKKVYSCTWEE